MSFPQLYIDGKEEEKHGWSIPLRHAGVDATVGKQLPADFLWNSPRGLILVERKTWTDFVDSITGKSGSDGGSRIHRQLIDTPKATAVRVLLLEGPLPPYVNSGDIWPAERIDNAAVSLQWQFGTILIHSLNVSHTAQRLAAFYFYTQKDTPTSLLRPVPPFPEEQIYLNPEFRRKIAAMMCPPGWGEKAALLLPEHAKSPAEAVTMEQDELLKIPGIGKTRARQWVEFWQGGW